MTDVVIIGAGPAGLGAGWRLKERGISDFLILEKNSYPGGLAASFRTPEGFIFDVGGHVFFTRDTYFMDIVCSLLDNEMHRHVRNASIYLEEKNIPYPFQDNIADLSPPQQFNIALDFLGMSRAGDTVARNRKTHFLEWIGQRFGKTIADLFMIPYNRKVWAYDLKKMGVYWIAERVSTLNAVDILERIILGKNKRDWGPNAGFFYPEYGMGYLFQKMAQHLGSHIRFDSSVEAIDIKKKTLWLENGETVVYRHLISSVSIKELVRRTVPFPGARELREYKKAAGALRFNSGYVVGLGIDFNIQTDKHWIYFPEKEFPWFRMTVISNYSPSMAPPGKSSLMFDLSYNPYRGLKARAADIVPLLQRVAFLPRIEAKDIVSVFEKPVACFYPVPTLDRDEHLTYLFRFLERHHIRSIGRLGRWKYEEGNMDHAFLHGKAAADSILDI